MSSRQEGFHKIITRDKGVFNRRNFSISTDSVTWIQSYALFITKEGQLYSSDENDNNYLLLQYLQSCYVQIIPNINSNNQLNRSKRKLTSRKPSNNGESNGISSSFDFQSSSPPVIYIKTFDNEKLYIKIPSKNNFGCLLSTLMVWQNLKPKGLVKKWFSENRFDSPDEDITHEVLVCRFKVYGPILTKSSKNLNIVNGPKVPVYQKGYDSKFDLSLDNSSNSTGSSSGSSAVNEGWFYTMGVLRSNGILNFITELDGTLIYSIDIKSIMSSEIREVHHSIFDNSNVLFLGQIKELRWNNQIKSVSPSINDQNFNSFLMKDGKSVASNQRILIEFPLHIDLEDWFVGLNYFSQREYIGSYNPNTISANTGQNDIITDDVTQGEVSFNIGETTQTSINTNPNPRPVDPNNGLKLYEKEFFRVSKQLSIDIIEAKFDDGQSQTPGKIYAEVVMWGLPWSRTAIVNHTANPFWKEEFSTDLPISTQIIHIVIKRCSFNESSYLSGDKIIGTVYITPDILTRQLDSFSTMLMDGGIGGNSINIKGLQNVNNNGHGASNDIVNLSIYDSANLPIGKLLVTVNLKEYHILSSKNFKPLENMLYNAPMKDLVQFCNENVASSDFENVSLIMLDIFQSLGIEDKWFKALMEMELVNVDKVTRQNYVRDSGINQTSNPTSKANATSSSNNVFNTLFRGSSIFSKSLEKYNLRIGQEYLEKVFGDFFAVISKEKKNCEVDPRYVKLQERAERKGKSLDDSDLEDDSELDSDYDSDEEEQSDKRVKMMIEENYGNLFNYAEMIWHKIYITSNDLPEQIKNQLKYFRNKVELACDPNDKITSLNCLSAFIFLRFFCPAILNPKLFYLTKNHQTGRAQRTLTLIAKILLNLANRQEFSPHKEPHLVRMNTFLQRHTDELYDYFDKITGRKNDFNEKILELSHEVKRFDLGLSDDSASSELPTTPYLIDKYLRLTELIYLLDGNSVDNLPEIEEEKGESNGKAKQEVKLENRQMRINAGSDEDEDDDEEDDDDDDDNDVEYEDEFVDVDEGKETQEKEVVNINDEAYDHFDPMIKDTKRNVKLNNIKNDDIKVKNDVYQIGSLEFEKSEFLDLAGDNQTEGFLKSLCKSDENIFSFITSNITLKDLQKTCNNLKLKILENESYLSQYEYPKVYQGDQQMWEYFTTAVLDKAYLDLTRNNLVQLDFDTLVLPHHYKKLSDNALTSLKLKFTDDNSSFINGFTNDSTSGQSSGSPSKNTKLSDSTSDTSLNGGLKSTTKNPFKKWFNK